MHRFIGRTIRLVSWKRFTGWACAGLAVGLYALSTHGQTVPAAPATAAPASTTTAAPAEQTPTFSTNVDEVSLDLVVHDKKHRPVLDLKPEDLAITDEG